MASTNGNKQNNRQNNNQAQRGYSVGENIHHKNVAAGNQGFQSGKNYTGNLGSFMQKANAPKNDYRAESITQQKGGYTGSSVSPADMASAAGQFASSDKMKDKWRGRGGKFEALKSDPSIVNTMNQAKANLANWNATKGKQLGYPAGMNTIAGVKPLTNLMLDRNLNVGAGVNPTTGMGFMDSIKSNAYVDRPLPSAGKGILGLLSGVTGVPGMALGMLPNLFKNLSTDIGNTYNAFGNMVRAPSITSGLTGLYDDFTQGLKAESVPLMQGVNNPFGNMFNTTPDMLTSGAGTGSAIAGMNRWGMPSEFDTDQGLWTGSYKSGAVAPEAVTQSMFTGTPMKRPDQPDTLQFAPRFTQTGDAFDQGTISLAPQFQSNLMNPDLINANTPGLASEGVATVGKNSLAEEMGYANTQDFNGDGIVNDVDSAISAQNMIQGVNPGAGNILAGGLDALQAANQNFQNQQQLQTDPFASAYTGMFFNK